MMIELRISPEIERRLTLMSKAGLYGSTVVEVAELILDRVVMRIVIPDHLKNHSKDGLSHDSIQNRLHL